MNLRCICFGAVLRRLKMIVRLSIALEADLPFRHAGTTADVRQEKTEKPQREKQRKTI